MATAPNVVRLPTAARRMVNQRWNRQTQAAAREMRAEWPGEYFHPSARERTRKHEAASAAGVVRSAELALILALYDALPGDVKSKALSSVMAMGERLPDCPTSQQAATIAALLALND